MTELKRFTRAGMGLCQGGTCTKIVRHWAGWLDISADQVPIIDKVNEIPGLFIACGFTGHGFGIGPGVGTIMSQLVIEEPTCV